MFSARLTALHCIFWITFYFLWSIWFNGATSPPLLSLSSSSSSFLRRSIALAQSVCVTLAFSHRIRRNYLFRSILNEIAMHERKVSKHLQLLSNAGPILFFFVEFTASICNLFTSLPIVIGIHWANCEKIFFPFLILPLQLSVSISMVGFFRSVLCVCMCPTLFSLSLSLLNGCYSKAAVNKYMDLSVRKFNVCADFYCSLIITWLRLMLFSASISHSLLLFLIQTTISQEGDGARKTLQ